MPTGFGRREVYMLRVLSIVVILMAPCVALAGEWIVFESQRSGGGDLYAVSPAGGKARFLVGGEAPERAVRLDRARGRLVYHQWREGGSMLMADGDDVFPDPSTDVAPEWAAGGDLVVYSRKVRGLEHIYTAEVDGGGEQQLTLGRVRDRHPTFCGGDGQVVFARTSAKKVWDLFILDLTDGSIEQLTQRGVYVGHPACSPDGRSVAFDTFYKGQAEIAVLDLENREITRLTNRPGNDIMPAWSADSRRLVFASEPAGSGNWDVWTVSVDDGEVVRVTRHPAHDGGPIWVPAEIVEPLLEKR